MASSGITVLHKTFLLPMPSSKCCNNQIFPLRNSQFLSSNSLSMLKKKKKKKHQILNPSLQNHKLPVISAAQTKFLQAFLTILRVGRDGIEAGTSLVPDAVPRPIARISVAAVAVTLTLFVLKSFISTAFFALAVMGLCYFTFIALNKDEAPKGGGGETSTSVDDSLEEARKIMEKYK